MKKVFWGLFVIFSIFLNAQTDTSGVGTYRATDEIKTSLKHTLLKLNINFEKHHLLGEAWITAKPYYYTTDSLILDAKAMLIHQVKINEQNLNYTYDQHQLKIKLDKSYSKEDSYTIYIQYTAQPEEYQKMVGEDKTDVKGLYFINPKGEEPEKPTQVWTQGEIESSSVWFPTIDSPNQKTTSEIYITVPEKYVTLSNGILKSSQLHKNQLRTDYWVMDLPHAPYLFFLGIGDFAVVEDGTWENKVPISYYVEKEYENVAKTIFGSTKEMLSFFSKRFKYEFPWQKYAQMAVRDFVAGAMENTTAVSFSEDVQQKKNVLEDHNYWETIIAHEMGHHWFGNLVTAESWANLSLNESFANYSEYLWLEYKYGKDVAENHLTESKKLYESRTHNFNKQLVRFNYDDKDDTFDLVSYNKGGAILHMLRDYLGDDAFFDGLSDYLHTHEFGTGEVHQFRQSLEKISGKDLNWFFNQWFYDHGHPIIAVNEQYNSKSNSLQITITQEQKNTRMFQFPLEIDIYTKDSVIHKNLWVNAKKDNVFNFYVEEKPLLVNVNPRGVILMTEKQKKTKNAYTYQYQNSQAFKSRLQALDFAEINRTKNILWAGLQDKSSHLRIKSLNALAGFSFTHKELNQIEQMAKKDAENLVKSSAMWLLASQQNPKYLDLYENGLYSESYAIRNAGIHGVSILNPEKALPLLKNGNPKDFSSDQLIALASVIVRHQLKQYIETLLPYFINYVHLKEQGDIEKAKVFEAGFLWAMQLDESQYVNIISKILLDSAPYSEKGSAYNQGVIEILKKAIEIKKKKAPTATNKQQIKQLKEVMLLF